MQTWMCLGPTLNSVCRGCFFLWCWGSNLDLLHANHAKPFEPFLYPPIHFLFYCFFPGSQQLYSRLTPDSELRSNFWQSSQDYLGCQGLDPGWPHARRTPYLLYSCSSLPFSNSYSQQRAQRSFLAL